MLVKIKKKKGREMVPVEEGPTPGTLHHALFLEVQMAEDGLPSFPALFPRGEQMETASRDGAGNILFFEKPTHAARSAEPKKRLKVSSLKSRDFKKN